MLGLTDLGPEIAEIVYDTIPFIVLFLPKSHHLPLWPELSLNEVYAEVHVCKKVEC